MEKKDWVEKKEKLDTRCNDGSIFDATDVELKEFLKTLCHGPVDNERIRHLFINRASLINTIRTIRFMERLERSSSCLAKIALCVSVVATVAALYSIYDSKNTTTQLDRLVKLQREELEELKKQNNFSKKIEHGLQADPR